MFYFGSLLGWVVELGGGWLENVLFGVYVGCFVSVVLDGLNCVLLGV